MATKFLLLALQEGKLIVTRVMDRKKSKAMHGLTRALCNNMVIGVSQGFEKKMQMIGVGYRAAVEGKQLTLSVGYCHPVILEVPEGVNVEVISFLIGIMCCFMLLMKLKTVALFIMFRTYM